MTLIVPVVLLMCGVVLCYGCRNIVCGSQFRALFHAIMRRSCTKIRWPIALSASQVSIAPHCMGVIELQRDRSAAEFLQ
ncbi:hypothetical protein [Herminiimonas sp. CN]|uniref:hypothetical protein n=1 Tax=Herminiimonas sp. CN TaxID=1349818 RepID=UPI0012DC1151|nr:hypothetical protein [Herminiimonas sp. CN]